jgi:hypothetical protein
MTAGVRLRVSTHFWWVETVSSHKPDSNKTNEGELPHVGDDRQLVLSASKHKTLLESFRSGKMKTVANWLADISGF